MQLPETTSRDGSRFWRWISALGIVFAVLYTLGMIVLDGSPPPGSAGGAAIVRYYNANGVETFAAAFVIAGTAVALAFFVTALRRALADGDESQPHLALVVTVGAAIYTSGLLFTGLLLLALSDAATAHQTGAAEALALLQGDDFLPVVAGLAIMGLGTGVAGLRSRRLPLWVSIPSLIIGVLALGGPAGEIAFLITPIWAVLLTVGLLIGSRRRSTRTAPEPAIEGA